MNATSRSRCSTTISGTRNLVYETEFAKLKTSAKVDSWRIPYSAAIYPERSGGLAAARSSTGTVLGKYDVAFNHGQSLAESYDRRRKLRTGVRRGAVRSARGTYTYYDAAPWEGYCSGFTASTIRHPELAPTNGFTTVSPFTSWS